MIKQIMLVDDEPSTNYYNRYILSESELVEDFLICEDVDTAIQELTLCETPPEIILLDLNMPRKTGWEFLEEYEQLDPEKQAMYLFILSASARSADVEQAKQHPLVDGYFEKPLALDAIRPYL